MVVTRFAPSPTGALHIGGARTALFNYLFARKHNGKFLLRIEDTDQERSKAEHEAQILESLSWLGIHWDEEPIHQLSRAARHKEVAESLVAAGNAYYCYATPEEIESYREQAKAEGRSLHFRSPWREGNAPIRKDVAPAIRLKVPLEGSTIIEDSVQGHIEVSNSELDDMVLLRGNGSPTYMLAVVVDDHDMGVTHIIRGDDHLTNGLRQIQLYKALKWEVPIMAHIPLIHGSDGAKLSKRHGATSAGEYKNLGYLPEAMTNYLIRLGWSHGDQEFFTMEEAEQLFNLESVNQAPARFDAAKLSHFNSHYLRQKGNEALIELLKPFWQQKGIKYREEHKTRLMAGLTSLKERSNTLIELAEASCFYLMDAEDFDYQSISSTNKETLEKCDSNLVVQFVNYLPELEDSLWQSELTLSNCSNNWLKEKGAKLAKIGPAIRLALAGTTTAPGVFAIMAALGKDETRCRLEKFLQA